MHFHTENLIKTEQRQCEVLYREFGVKPGPIEVKGKHPLTWPQSIRPFQREASGAKPGVQAPTYHP